MGDLIPFSRKIENKELVLQNPVDIVTNILTRPQLGAPKQVVFLKEVKNILKSRGIDYRVAHKEVDAKLAPKSKTILFESQKLGFVLGGMQENTNVGEWTFEFIELKHKQRAIDIVDFMLQRISERNF